MPWDTYIDLDSFYNLLINLIAFSNKPPLKFQTHEWIWCNKQVLGGWKSIQKYVMGWNYNPSVPNNYNTFEEEGKPFNPIFQFKIFKLVLVIRQNEEVSGRGYNSQY